MGEITGISWCDHTWNPWIGCARVSPACDGCYAAALMGEGGRFSRAVRGGPGAGVGTRTRTGAKTWNDPIRWNRAAEAAGARRFVFCASLADIFDNAVPADWRAEAFDVMRRTPALTYLLLTKRPGNIVKLSAEAGGLPVNAAIGCTVVTQEEADRDVPKLLAAKGQLKPAFAFLSMEPLLSSVDLTKLPWRFNAFGEPADIPVKTVDALAGRVTSWDRAFPVQPGEVAPTLDWVITGGETDQGPHKARPTATEWFRTIRDQCARAGVAYHHKQNGEWAPASAMPSRFAATAHQQMEGTAVYRVGKDHAGRLLDGELHDARPEVKA